MVTIETESQMGAGGKSGAVKAKFKYERWLDDDAHLISPTDNGYDEMAQVEMSGTGEKGNNLSVNMTRGFSRGDSDYTTAKIDEHGHSIFRPGEAKHTEELLNGTINVMRAMAEVMLNGGFAGATPPWENGRCVDLKLRSDPAKRTGAEPKTTYTVFAEPRAKKDGAPASGTVKGTLKGAHSLSPQDKVKADAQFNYENPGEKDQSATIDFEARSKRGVGKASLQFDTKKGGYRITSKADSQAFCPDFVITSCDISKPFSAKVCNGRVTMSHTPGSDKGGSYSFHFSSGGGVADSAGTYTLSGPEESMTATYTSPSVCGTFHGRTVCTKPRGGTATWTKIDSCK
ncbi:MAG: hypothetical protein JF567_05440, partial [Xanthomonadales bacterium]|nr:hypothetical protein [Xanthomonadales bacterium]